MKKVKMYCTSTCPFCTAAENLLSTKNITNFEKINIENSPELKDEMIKITGRHTVPQIFIDDFHVGGCDDLYLLEKDEKLDKLLS